MGQKQIKKLKSQQKKIKQSDTLTLYPWHTPYRLAPLERADFVWALAIGLITAILYYFTTAPSITTEDAGDFVIGALQAGVVHPPGFPLYILLAHLFSLISWAQDPAFAINFLSGLFGAASVSVLYLIARRLSVGDLYAATGAWLFAFSGIFWSQSVVAEVYSLNVLLVLFTLLCTLNYLRAEALHRTPLATRWWAALWLAIGLGLANHYPLFLLGIMAIVLVLPLANLKRPQRYAIAFASLVLGLSPYLVLYWRATDPSLQYNYGHIQDWDSFLFHVLRKTYDKLENQNIALADKWQFVWSITKLFAQQFHLFLIPAAAGAVILARRHLRLAALVGVTFLGASYLLLLRLNLPFNPVWANAYRVYPLVPFAMCALLAAYGLQWLLSRWQVDRRLIMAIPVIALALQLTTQARVGSHANNWTAAKWSEMTLASLAPNANLIVCGDLVWPIYYTHLIRGVRPDVTIYDRFSLVTKDNLYAPHVASFLPARVRKGIMREKERALVLESGRPTYVSCHEVASQLGFAYRKEMLSYRVLADSSIPADTPVIPSPEMVARLMESAPQDDYWANKVKESTLSELLAYLLHAPSTPQWQRYASELMERYQVTSNVPVLVGMANYLYLYQLPQQSVTYLKMAESINPQAIPQASWSLYCQQLRQLGAQREAERVCAQLSQ